MIFRRTKSKEDKMTDTLIGQMREDPDAFEEIMVPESERSRNVIWDQKFQRKDKAFRMWQFLRQIDDDGKEIHSINTIFYPENLELEGKNERRFEKALREWKSTQIQKNIKGSPQ